MNSGILKPYTKVYIRDDLNTFDDYGDYFVACEMEQYAGMYVTIVSYEGDGSYKIAEDNRKFNWTLDMFDFGQKIENEAELICEIIKTLLNKDLIKAKSMIDELIKDTTKN